MSLKNISRRIDDLEASYAVEELIVLVNVDGKKEAMTVDELIRRGLTFDAFEKVLHGDSLSDLDKLLSTVESVIK